MLNILIYSVFRYKVRSNKGDPVGWRQRRLLGYLWWTNYESIRNPENKLANEICKMYIKLSEKCIEHSRLETARKKEVESIPLGNDTAEGYGPTFIEKISSFMPSKLDISFKDYDLLNKAKRAVSNNKITDLESKMKALNNASGIKTKGGSFTLGDKAAGVKPEDSVSTPATPCIGEDELWGNKGGGGNKSGHSSNDYKGSNKYHEPD